MKKETREHKWKGLTKKIKREICCKGLMEVVCWRERICRRRFVVVMNDLEGGYRNFRDLGGARV
ncbi:hypothetical protein Hdeb2414_s0017g00504331 [Helianthus debilis subsp. tardiflorus]